MRARSSEFETIRRLAERFAGGGASGVLTGIGDDAAVLEPPAGKKLVFTVDEQVEGVHFTRALVPWEDVGWRSFMAAASDVAAMGAEPWCVLSALSLPGDVEDADVDAIARGQRDAADRIGASIVGGNVTRGPAAVVTTAVLGVAERAVLRSGARAGDGLWVAGALGLAAAGLAALRAGLSGEDLQGRFEPSSGRSRGPATKRWRRRAAIDVSDGLAQDVAHVARASGVRAVLDEVALREHAASTGLAAVGARLGRDPLDFVLRGGEDYALVVASAAPIPGFWRAGTFEGCAAPDVALLTARGEVQPIAPEGFDHLASGSS